MWQWTLLQISNLACFVKKKIMIFIWFPFKIKIYYLFNYLIFFILNTAILITVKIMNIIILINDNYITTNKR